MKIYRIAKDSSDIRALKKEIKMLVNTLKETNEKFNKASPEYKVVFNPSSGCYPTGTDVNDFKVMRKFDTSHRLVGEFGYDCVKAYPTRAAAEKGLELIKKELALNS